MRVNAAWLNAVSTDPTLLVDRKEELDDFVRRLEEYREARLREAHILVTGARGVGKSILTRAALRLFERRYPEVAVCIKVDGRSVRYRPFLNRLANDMVALVKPRAESSNRRDIARWLDQLALLANNSQVTRAQTETLARSYETESTVGADLLIKLQNKLSWSETRSLGQTTQVALQVTDELLHAAITATLERLAAEDSVWFVVVFFDDLDQALGVDHEDAIADLFRRVLDLRPCISIVHFRTEALIDNVSREATEKIDIRALPARTLFDLVLRRLEAAPDAVRAQFAAADWTPVHRLAAHAGSPLVLLKWVHGLLRSQDWPPPPEWSASKHLRDLVLTADPLNGADGALLQRLAEIVDRCDAGQAQRGVRHEDLARGSALTDPGSAADRLSDEEINLLVRLQVLLPRHRFRPELGYRMQPVLDLLRPSVQRGL